MILAEELLNQGGGLEVPDCWTAVIWEKQSSLTFDDIQVLESISHSFHFCPDDTEPFSNSSKCL